MRLIPHAVLPILVIATLSIVDPTTASAQERLPAYVRNNTYVAGQVLGCTIRLERYFAHTLDRAASAGRVLPVTELDVVAGLDLQALKADAKQALVAQGGGTYPTEELELAVSEIADGEYDGSLVGLPGYSEAWLQAMGCAALFLQFELYDSYR